MLKVRQCRVPDCIHHDMPLFALKSISMMEDEPTVPLQNDERKAELSRHALKRTFNSSASQVEMTPASSS